MDIRQLQIFAEVAKHLSFSKAAQTLHVAQPAISIAIKKLEHELDTVLLNRGAKKVSLTPEGEYLLAHAKKMLLQMAEAKLEMRELKGLVKGKVSIAMPAMYASYYFPDIISVFRKQHPDLSILVKEAGTREIEQDLLNGDIDLGVVTLDHTSEALEVHPLLDEEMVACVAHDHPFAKAQSITFKEFFKEPLILVRPGYFLRETVDRSAQELGISPNIAFETNLMLLIKKLALSGCGVGTCLRFVLKDEETLKGVSFNPQVLFRMGLAWRKGHYLSTANRAFIDFVLSQ